MYKLLRYLRQHRGKIALIVSAVVFFFLILYTLNELLLSSAKENKKENTDIVENSKPVGEQTNYAVISDKTIPEKTDKSNNNILDTFVKYCNSREYSLAFDMLTDDCKKEIFSNDVEKFKKNYIDRKFNIYRVYKAQNWITTSDRITYYITFSEDILATGGIKGENDVFDYITIILSSNKISVAEYIYQKEINKEYTTNNNVTIKVKSVDTYMDYLKYNITIENKSDTTFCLDNREMSKSSYILNKNDLKFESFINEVSLSNLTVLKGTRSDIEIKYNKVYSNQEKIKKICFENVIYDYDSYPNSKSKIEIEL